MEPDPFDEMQYLAANPDVALAVRKGKFKTGRDHYDAHGRKEGRRWDKSIPITREDKLLSNIRREGKGLEIGPSHNPIAPKSDGFDVDVLDHMDADGLKKKYIGHGINLDRIEDVDYVWQGENLVDLIGERSKYDWIIASHVIEHIPDPISFLQQCEQLLKPEGRLALVIPDKNYCFDYLQPISLTGSFLDAYHEKRKRPSPGQVFEHLSNASMRDSQPAWSASHSGPLSLIHSLEQSIQNWESARTSTEYFDVHCWRFMPESFALLISDLNAAGLIGLSVYAEYETVGCEFYAVLQKGQCKSPALERLKTLQAIRER